MTQDDIFTSAPEPRPSWWQLRRQRRLAALHGRKVMSDAAFGILTIDNVRRMYGLRQTRGALIHMGVFGIAAIQALTQQTPGVRHDAEQFGPVGQAVPWVHAFLYDGGSKEAKPPTGIERTVEWGEDCDRLLTNARRRYSRWKRAAVGMEQWVADLHKTFPYISKGFVWVITNVLSIILGWLLRGWLGGK